MNVNKPQTLLNYKKVRYIYLFLFLCSFVFANAQYGEIDSLQSSLVETSTDTIKMEVYLTLGKLYTPISADTSLYYSQKSYDIAKKNNWNRKQVEALIDIGYRHMENRDLDKCFQSFAEALNFSKQIRDTFSMGISSNAIGTAYWEQNDNEVAVRHFQNAHDWSQQANNRAAYKASLNIE